MSDAVRVVEILGGESLKKRMRNGLDLVRAVEGGLPASTVRRVSAYVGRTPAEVNQVARLVVARATLERRLRAGERLSVEESERAERVARVMALAEQVLESAEEARDFLFSPHALLGGQAPIALVRTDLGARQVEDLLWKLEYSLPV